MPLIPFYDGLTLGLNTLFRQTACPTTNKVLLCSTTSFTRASTIVDVLTQEPLNSDGYARGNYSPGAPSTNTGLQLVALPPVNVPFTIAADKPALTFDCIVLLANGSAKANNTVSAIASNVFTSNAHGLALNDKIFFTATVLPSGISAGVVYFAKTITTDTFEIAATSGGATITGLGTSWTGTLVCRYANGTIVAYQPREDDGAGNNDRTISPGQTHTVPVTIDLK